MSTSDRRLQQAQSNARFWERQARAAEDARDRLHQSRDQWRQFAFALAAEYTRELRRKPKAIAPLDPPQDEQLDLRIQDAHRAVTVQPDT